MALQPVYRNGQLIAYKAEGNHAFDANGVCIYCSRCTDTECCDLEMPCPNNDPRPADLSPSLWAIWSPS